MNAKADDPKWLKHSRRLFKGITDIILQDKSPKYKYCIKTVFRKIGANSKSELYEKIKDVVFLETNENNLTNTKGIIYEYKDDLFTGAITGTVRNAREMLVFITKISKIHKKTSISIALKNIEIKIDNQNLFYQSKLKLNKYQFEQKILELKKIKTFCRYITKRNKVFFLRIQKDSYSIEIGNLIKANYKTFDELNKRIRKIIKFEQDLIQIKEQKYEIQSPQKNKYIVNELTGTKYRIKKELKNQVKYKYYQPTIF